MKRLINRVKKIEFDKSGYTRAIRAFAVVFISLLIAFVLIKLKPKEKHIIPENKGILVETFFLKPLSVSMDVEAYGTVKAREQIELIAEVGGKVDYLPDSFKEGNFIEKGEILLRIDKREFELNVKSAEARLHQARAELLNLDQEVSNFKKSIEIAGNDLRLSEKEYHRFKELAFQKVVAQTSADKAEQKYLASLNAFQSLKNQTALTLPRQKMLRAEEIAAEAAYERALLELEKTEIKAPFNGWVMKKSVTLGEYVRNGQNIGNVYKENRFDIDINVPVKDILWITPVLNEKNKKSDAIIFYGTEEKNIFWNGRVTRIKSQMEDKTRTVPIVVEVDDRISTSGGDMFLRPGMFVTILIKGKRFDNIYVLPRDMLHIGDYVYSMADNKLEKLKVTVLRKFKDKVYITDGITEKDMIIKTQIPEAVEGMLLRTS